MNGAKEIVKALKRLSKGRVMENVPMSAFTSMGVGGPAEAAWSPVDSKELCRILDLCEREGFKYEVLGAGTNVIVKDGGIEGLTVLMRGALDWVEADGVVLRAGCGASLPRLAGFAARAGLSGLEFAGGIPGTVGGAMQTNAGAFGGCIADVLKRALLRLSGGEIVEWGNDRFEFGYRSSKIPKGAVVLEAVFELSASTEETVKARMKEMDEKRRQTQPRGVMSAGSIFKNPKGDSAAKLIDSAGLKGLKVGKAMVSEKHAGYIVNTGGASARDVLALMEEVRRRVFELYGVELEPEVKIIGKEMN